MARKTKAQLNAEYQAERERELAEQKASYPTRLMSLLEKATKEGYDLRVVEGVFELTDPNRRYNDPTVLTYDFTASAQWVLEDLESELEALARSRAEAERRYAVKQAALAKLSAEERELLGL